MVRSNASSDQGQRQLRVGELLRKALAEIFQRTEINDPDLSGVLLTVTEVKVSPDLRNATAFVLPLGGEKQDQVLGALKRHERFLRGEVTRRVSLKFSPNLSFKLDDSFERSQKLDQLLRSPKVSRDLG